MAADAFDAGISLRRFRIVPIVWTGLQKEINDKKQ